ncbi:MAG: hypothetical protein HC903_28985 [Methylacidiphilales bacterium]|nr:hypothetical protein [Candidatus Methylacidiphilales bacterium]NJR18718.1 hypothetical protein [Calothrix sp. CSU_2_0]
MLEKFSNIYEEISSFLEVGLSDAAEYTLDISRDEGDSYSLRFNQIRSISSRPLSKRKAMSIVPVGSQWSYFLGWRDIFGIPIFENEDDKWLSFGFETVLPHKTRGAYLYLKAFFLPFPLKKDVLDKIDEFADVLGDYSIADEKISFIHRMELKCRGSTEINASSSSMYKHRAIEAWIIREANQRYRKRETFLFRTLVMKKNQIPSFWGQNFVIAKRSDVWENPAR